MLHLTWEEIRREINFYGFGYSFYSHSIYGQVDVGKLVVEIAFFLGIDRGHQFTQHDSSNLEINPLFKFI